jgi:uncharacterized protein (DUF302 family)
MKENAKKKKGRKKDRMAILEVCTVKNDSFH